MSKEIKCPKCNSSIKWKKTDKPNVLEGKCINLKCGLEFIKVGDSIISKPTFSKK